MIQVIPAVLPASFNDLSEKVERVVGSAPLIQIDIVDGVYAPEATWPYNSDPEDIFQMIMSGEIKLPHTDTLEYEADLMVQAPESTLDVWLSAGFSALILHVESTGDLHSLIERVKTSGHRVGLALKPSTENDTLTPFIDSVDFVQCMGSDVIGYHGVPLDPRVLGKVRDLRMRFPELQIGIDIGVNFDTAPELIAAGATRLASGSLILKSDNPKEVIQKLKGETV